MMMVMGWALALILSCSCSLMHRQHGPARQQCCGQRVHDNKTKSKANNKKDVEQTDIKKETEIHPNEEKGEHYRTSAARSISSMLCTGTRTDRRGQTKKATSVCEGSWKACGGNRI